MPRTIISFCRLPFKLYELEEKNHYTAFLNQRLPQNLRTNHTAKNFYYTLLPVFMTEIS